MHDYLFPIEVVRFAFVAGVVVSMFLYERRHLTTGSIVVPGYVAVFLLEPSIIVATMLNASVAYFVVNRVLSRWFLLYGRTKFTVLAMISISIQALMLKVSPSGPWLWEADVPLFVGVGYVVPALIAHDMARQGIAKTAKSVLLASVVVAAPILLAVVFRPEEITALGAFQPISHTHLEPGWIPLAVLLSAAAAWAVARNYGLRSGGFIGAALVAVFAVNPWQVLFIAGVAVFTHQLVTRVLMTRLILFGRRKFATMLMLSSAIVWCGICVGQRLLPVPMQLHLGVTSVALTPLFLPGLLANDMQRSSISRVVAGVTLASTFVLTVTWTVESFTTGQAQPMLRTGVALMASVAVFAPQLWSLVVAVGTRLLSVPQQTWARIEPRLGAAPSVVRDAVVAPRLAVVAVERPSTAHPARPHGHRVPSPVAADPSDWLAGRKHAQALVERGPMHLAGSPAQTYRPRHLAATATHGAYAASASESRAS